NNRAAAHIYLGRYDRAIADLDRALALEPGFAHGYWVRSQAHALNGDLPRAQKDQEKAEEINPSYKGKRAKPIAPLPRPEPTKLSKEDRDEVDRLLDQAGRDHDKGNYKAIVAPADAVLRLDPANVRARELKANALARDRPADAFKVASEAVQLDPDSWMGFG